MDRAKFLKLVGGSGALLFLPDWSATSQAVSAGDAPLTVTPVREGASLRTYSGLGLLSDNRVIDIGYKRVVSEAYPLLYQATRHMGAAMSPKVEWLVPTTLGRFRAEHNYTQIFRTPFGITNTQISSFKYGKDADEKLIQVRKKALADHLATVEKTIATGKRAEVKKDGHPIRQMGGVKTFKGKNFSLLVLRDLCLCTNRQANDMDMYQEEFLSEITLKVTK